MSLAPNTVLHIARTLDMFERWVLDLYPGAPPALLSKRLMLDFRIHLLTPGRRARGRAASTIANYLSHVCGMWRWAFDEEGWEGLIPVPRVPRLPAPVGRAPVAPTWAEMDAAIAAAEGSVQQLAVLLRFTGLRVEQAASLTWEDVDLERGRLEIRGELGKSRRERAGRRVPLSPHLVEILRTWHQLAGRGEHLVTGLERTPAGRQRQLRAMGRAWKAAEVRPAVWQQRPHHAFRKGWVTELARAGADREAVEILVGHSRGVRDFYADPEGLPLVEAVALIPPLSMGPYRGDWNAIRAVVDPKWIVSARPKKNTDAAATLGGGED